MFWFQKNIFEKKYKKIFFPAYRVSKKGNCKKCHALICFGFKKIYLKKNIRKYFFLHIEGMKGVMEKRKRIRNPVSRREFQNFNKEANPMSEILKNQIRFRTSKKNQRRKTTMKAFRNDSVRRRTIALGSALLLLAMSMMLTERAQAIAEDLFVDSEQALGSSSSYDVALGDINEDGHLDAFVANNGANKVWLNLGDGSFRDSTRVFGNSNSRGVALGDLDGDGALDAFIANSGANKVWMNNGRGLFDDSLQTLGGFDSTDVALGDLDSDGDLDAFVTNASQGNKVWLNFGGYGDFIDSEQSLGTSYSRGVVLGDLDGDGDLDAFIANWNTQPNKIWLNDGDGNFIDSGYSLGNGYSYDIALGDVDGDGDLDAFIGNGYYRQANKVWLNNGHGGFTDSMLSLGNAQSIGVALGDLDGDGDFDTFIANNYYSGADKVWLNNSHGTFMDTGLELGHPNGRAYSVALGDLDGDCDLDAFVANYSGWANKVYMNTSQACGELPIPIPGDSTGDIDKDGLPDTWEREHFGNLSESRIDDYDGDGYSNLDEYNRGSDPTDPNDPDIPLLCTKGDVNGDDQITSQDAVEAFQLSLKSSWTSDEICRADFNGDGEITAQDAIEIFWETF